MAGKRFARIGGCVAAAVAAATLSASYAQNYPAKPVRFVSPFPAGGVNDIIARIIAHKMSETLGQQWVVENRPGAGGNLGTDYVSKSAPDGYTLLNGGMGSLTVNPFTGTVPYDTLRDFAPIILMARAPNVVTVHPALPVRSITGAYRARQSAARRTQLRVWRRWQHPAPFGRAVRAHGRHQHRACSLQRRIAGDHRSARRPGSAFLSGHSIFAAAHQGRQIEGTRGYRHAARARGG